MDRIRWWSNPPMTMRPTPALAGWTMEEWIAVTALIEPSHEERYRLVFPSTLVRELDGRDLSGIVAEALRLLTLEDEVERIGEYEPFRWRARPKARVPA